MFSFLVKFCILVIDTKGFFGRKKGAHYGHIMKIISFNLSHLDSKF
jgi:hypothetical protein